MPKIWTEWWLTQFIDVSKCSQLNLNNEHPI